MRHAFFSTAANYHFMQDSTGNSAAGSEWLPWLSLNVNNHWQP
jgi:hypothetical protein